MSSKRKRMRLPNGFGQISEIKGKRLRNPFRVMVPDGKDENGRPKSKMLKPNAYFRTYNDAYEALVKYHSDKYYLTNELTMNDLYEKWLPEYSETKSASSIRTQKSVWKYCETLWKVSPKDLRPSLLRTCMDSASVCIAGKTREAAPNIKKRIHQLVNMLLDYAVEYDLIERNPCRSLKMPATINSEIQNARVSHIAFTDEEMAILWKSITQSVTVQCIVLQCYTGLRPQELCEMRSLDTIDSKYLVGGMKTDAGRNRIVPLHESIIDLAKNLKELSELRGDGKLIPFTYPQYKANFYQIIDELGLNSAHKPHDCRKQFVTMAKKYKVDEYALKRIVGHSIKDITEAIYTERHIDWLIEEVNKIKVDGVGVV